MKLNKKALIIGLAIVISLVAAVGVFAAEDTVTGIIEKTDTGLIIKAANATYLLLGKDLSSMIGEKVEIIGTITESKIGKALSVISVKEIK